MQQTENELDQVQEQLSLANTKLEEKDKALQNVSRPACLRCCRPIFFSLFTLSSFFYVLANNIGRGGGSQPSEENAAAWERSWHSPGTVAEGQQRIGREGQGSPECKLAREPKSQNPQSEVVARSDLQLASILRQLLMNPKTSCSAWKVRA